MKSRIPFLCLIFAFSANLHGKPCVRFEKIPTTPATWKFTQVPGPSKSDIAQNAEIKLSAGSLDAKSASLAILVNGLLPANVLEWSQETFFSGHGSFVIDLGKTEAIAAVGTFSCHEYAIDQGARGPQVYTLFGSNDQQKWSKIIDVDTRPNKTGEGWNGCYGALISDDVGNQLGEYRYLMFEVSPTFSPKQPNPIGTNTFFAEIDVHTSATLPRAGDAGIAPPVQKPGA